MKRVNVKKLPKEVLDRISIIEYPDDVDDDVMGFVWLKDGYEFDDGGQMLAFESVSDLIYEVKHADVVRG